MQNTTYAITLLLVTTLSASFGALFFKQGMNTITKLSLKSILTSLWIWIGTCSYIISAVTNIYLLKIVDYSIGFPMTSFSYVWTVFISYFVFKEKITLSKIIAMCCIILGVFLISI